MMRFLPHSLLALTTGLFFGACTPQLPPVSQITAGASHTCALDSDIDGVRCWGDNSQGQSTVPNLIAPRYIAAGGNTSCAIDNATVRCWGDNRYQQLQIPALNNPSAVAVGESHVCALTADGVICWGDNSVGQLAVPYLNKPSALSAGAHHTCAIASGGAYCWGDNSHGQLQIPNLSGIKQIAAGGRHTCALDLSGVKCWGGDVPALLSQIPATSQAKAIASGRYHSCVLDAAGVQCWGDASIANGLPPRELTRVSQLVVGGGSQQAHACVHHQQGIVCWGDNQRQQTAYRGQPYHIVYRAEADINSPPEVVWDVLMDLDSYPLWNPFTIAMESSLEVGSAMAMRVKMSDLIILNQTEYIRLLEPGHKVCWGINTNTPEINSGERCQWLEPLPNGGTRYITEDLIEGTQTPTVINTFGNSLQTGFNGVAAGLKARAESLHSL